MARLPMPTVLLHGKLQKDGSIVYDHEHHVDSIDSTFAADGLIQQLKHHDPSLPPIKVKARAAEASAVQPQAFSVDGTGRAGAFAGLGVAGSRMDDAFMDLVTL